MKLTGKYRKKWFRVGAITIKIIIKASRSHNMPLLLNMLIFFQIEVKLLFPVLIDHLIVASIITVF